MLLSDGLPHAALLAASAATGAVCLGRALQQRWRPAGQAAVLDGLHAGMAAGMVLMLTLDLPTSALLLLGAAYGAVALGCLARLLLPTARAAYARLAVGAVAMSSMFAGMFAAPAAAAAPMPGMDHAMSHGMDHGTGLGVVGWVDVAVLLGLALVALVALVRSGRRHCRVGLGCEAVMALAMAAMFVDMV